MSTVSSLALLGASSGCGRGTVRIAFRPGSGARYGYQVTVTARTVTSVGEDPPQTSSDHQVLRAEQAVLSVDADGSRVQVRLTGDSGTRTFVVRLDRAAQLAEVQRVEGLPASVLGDLGLSEIFPAAAGAPPDRALAPGDHWSVDEPVTLPGCRPAGCRATAAWSPWAWCTAARWPRRRRRSACPWSAPSTRPTPASCCRARSRRRRPPPRPARRRRAGSPRRDHRALRHDAAAAGRRRPRSPARSTCASTRRPAVWAESRLRDAVPARALVVVVAGLAVVVVG